MLCSTFLSEIEQRLTDLENRARLIGAQVNDSQLNWKPADVSWSIGQIFEHLHIGNAKFLPIVTAAVDAAPFGRDREVRNTLLGRFLIKANAPGANTPAPKVVEPSAGPFPHSVVDRFMSECDAFRDLARRAAEADLNSTRFSSPILGWVKLNLVDAFGVVAIHGERHIGQIEMLMRREDFPK